MRKAAGFLPYQKKIREKDYTGPQNASCTPMVSNKEERFRSTFRRHTLLRHTRSPPVAQLTQAKQGLVVQAVIATSSTSQCHWLTCSGVTRDFAAVAPLLTIWLCCSTNNKTPGSLNKAVKQGFGCCDPESQGPRAALTLLWWGGWGIIEQINKLLLHQTTPFLPMQKQ